MIPDETKQKFILLRAENQSYTQITKALGISKSSCIKLQKELESEIATARADNLRNLYNSYAMTKEARIKELGNVLDNINTALADVDFTQIAPEKLLDYKLKYTQALKAEYTPLDETETDRARKFYADQIKDILKKDDSYNLRSGFDNDYLTQAGLNRKILLLDKLYKAETQATDKEDL